VIDAKDKAASTCRMPARSALKVEVLLTGVLILDTASTLKEISG